MVNGYFERERRKKSKDPTACIKDSYGQSVRDDTCRVPVLYGTSSSTRLRNEPSSHFVLHFNRVESKHSFDDGSNTHYEQSRSTTVVA
jgi:hypothetical protein